MSDDLPTREYEPLDTKDRTRRSSVELRLRDGRRYWLKYGDCHLMGLRADASALTAHFYSMTVVMLGRNLGEVATAIDGSNASWVQEFDPLRWDAPKDGRAVFIEKIELYQPKRGDEEASANAAPASGEGLSQSERRH